MDTRRFKEEFHHDSADVSRGHLSSVGPVWIGWVDTFEITHELNPATGLFEETSRKFLFSTRHEVPVGQKLLGLKVIQIDPEWIEREKVLLGSK